MKRSRVPASYFGPKPRVEVKPVYCVDCGGSLMHVEVMPSDDEPHGLPPELRCPDCGGPLVPIQGLH